jgi:hypothetical protein
MAKTLSDYDFTQCSFLMPDVSNWRFDRIASEDADRASRLEASGSSSALIDTLVCILAEAVTLSTARFGSEEAEACREDCRAVIQFRVTPQVFGWFFNGRSGYRAHFRAHPHCALSFNSNLLESVRLRLDEISSPSIPARLLNTRFEDCGGTVLAKTFVLTSLAPDLAKVWFCTKLIEFDGVVRDLPLGITGPKLLLDGGAEWVAPLREANDTWLEIKGAFLGREGPYQPKNPTDRAHQLHKTGTT